MDIEKLLKKKHWTGAELGRLQIAITSIAYGESFKNGESNPKPIVEKERMHEMLRTLAGTHEAGVYNSYIAMHEWIRNVSQTSLAQEQQALVQIEKINNILSKILEVENVFTYISFLPKIMTQKQYKNAVNESLKGLWDENEKPVKVRGLTIVKFALSSCLTLLKKHPRANNPLKPLKEKLSKEFVRDTTILEKYNKIMRRGYYVLEDGTRSDQVPPDELRKIISPELSKILNEDSKLSEDEKKLLNLKSTQHRIEEMSKNHYHGISAPAQKSFTKKIQWHYYKEPPKNLTKWDILKEGRLEDFYFSKSEEKNHQQEVKEFESLMTEFPMVIEAITNDIGEKYPDLSNLKGLTAEKLDKKYYPEKILFDDNFYSFRDVVTSDRYVFKDDPEAQNGIAILKNSTAEKYTMPDLNIVLRSPLEKYYPENKDYKDNKNEIKECRNLILQSVYFVQGFNAALNIIASEFDLEEVQNFSQPVHLLKEKIEKNNNLVYLIHESINDLIKYGGESADKQKKLETLKTVFDPIDLSEFEIPQAKIDEATKNISDLTGFYEHDLNPYLTLCVRDPQTEA
jgi:hypothetical protein